MIVQKKKKKKKQVFYIPVVCGDEVVGGSMVTFEESDWLVAKAKGSGGLSSTKERK